MDPGEMSYTGFREYVKERTRSLGSDERKKILTCLLLDESLPLFLQLLKDKKRKLEDIQAYALENQYGRIGLASASRGYAMMLKWMPIGEAVRLYRISRCFKSFRFPMTMAFIVHDWEAAVAYLTVRHAMKLVKRYESFAKSNGLLSKLKRVLRGPGKNAKLPDPLDYALSRCHTKHASTTYPIVEDIAKYLGSGLEQMVLADGEEKNSILLFPGKTCPIQSLAIFDASIGYAIYAADVG